MDWSNLFKEIVKTAGWCSSTVVLHNFAPNIASYTAKNCLEGLIEIGKAAKDFKNDPCRFVDPERLNDPNHREKVPRVCIEKIDYTPRVTASKFEGRELSFFRKHDEVPYYKREIWEGEFDSIEEHPKVSVDFTDVLSDPLDETEDPCTIRID